MESKEINITKPLLNFQVEMSQKGVVGIPISLFLHIQFVRQGEN